MQVTDMGDQGHGDDVQAGRSHTVGEMTGDGAASRQAKAVMPMLEDIAGFWMLSGDPKTITPAWSAATRLRPGGQAGRQQRRSMRAGPVPRTPSTNCLGFGAGLARDGGGEGGATGLARGSRPTPVLSSLAVLGLEGGTLGALACCGKCMPGVHGGNVV